MQLTTDGSETPAISAGREQSTELSLVKGLHEGLQIVCKQLMPFLSPFLNFKMHCGKFQLLHHSVEEPEIQRNKENIQAAQIQREGWGVG